MRETVTKTQSFRFPIRVMSFLVLESFSNVEQVKLRTLNNGLPLSKPILDKIRDKLALFAQSWFGWFGSRLLNLPKLLVGKTCRERHNTEIKCFKKCFFFKICCSCNVRK